MILLHKSTLLLFALSTHALAAVAADLPHLEFHYGVSQIPNYELKYSADFPHFSYLNADAPKGGTLVLPWLNPLNTVSPMYQPPGFYRSYDHLIERAGDEPSGYYGSLAESIGLSADRRRIVFRLRPEARWHDGRPISATDVKFSVETFRADKMAHGWAGALAWVTEVNILDPLTVEIRADSEVARQLFILGHMPIVPAHYWHDRDVREPITDTAATERSLPAHSRVSGPLPHIRTGAGLLGQGSSGESRKVQLRYHSLRTLPGRDGSPRSPARGTA